MNFKEYLEEGRDAPLFHGTDIYAAKSILEDNEISASTLQPEKDILGKNNKKKATRTSAKFTDTDEDSVHGVSLTRRIKYAHKRAEELSSFITIFELDQRKLVQRHKIVPFNYHSIFYDKPQNSRYEAEEFVVGPIKNIDKYIKRVYISSNTYKFNSSVTQKVIEMLDKRGIKHENL